MKQTYERVYAFCAFIAALVVISSLYLTVKFTVGFGVSYTAVVLALVGVSFELVKFLAPYLSSFFFKQGSLLIAGFSAMIALALCIVSFGASVATLDDIIVQPRIESSNVNSASTLEIQSVKDEIAMLSQRHESLMLQWENQTAISHITPAALTLREANEAEIGIRDANARLVALAENANNTESASFVITHGAKLIFLAALIIELVGAFLSIALFKLRSVIASEETNSSPNSHNDVDVLSAELKSLIEDTKFALESVKAGTLREQQPTDKPSLAASSLCSASKVANKEESIVDTPAQTEVAKEPVSNLVLAHSNSAEAPNKVDRDVVTVKVKALSVDTNATESDSESNDLADQRKDLIRKKIRESVVNHGIKPSIRGVASITSNRGLANEVFESLADEGVLVKQGRGYKLAS
ncbi:membrane hypothetical protein [Vibrio chagasii]|nr:membrane hypothetical protein [Vibrio chagasii]